MLTFILLWAALAGVLYVWNDNTALPFINPPLYRKFLCIVLIPWGYVFLWLLYIVSILEAVIKAVRSEVRDLRGNGFELRACWKGKAK